MYIEEAKVTVSMTRSEMWSIGCHIIRDVCSEYNAKNMKNHTDTHSYECWLSSKIQSITLARDFCKFTNDTYVDSLLKDFRKEVWGE